MSNPKSDLASIDALEKSKGWAVLMRIMHEEILQAAMAIAESPNMPIDEINFRRGSIWAGKRMLELPLRLRVKLENELALLGVDDKVRRDGA